MRERLNRYAVSLGLQSNAPLLGLLIVRELKSKSLKSTAKVTSKLKSKRKIVVRLPSVQGQAFAQLAKSLNRSRTDCALELLTTELAERFIERELLS